MLDNGDKFILIFGGNGFIGAECVDHLLNTYIRIDCVNKNENVNQNKKKII